MYSIQIPIMTFFSLTLTQVEEYSQQPYDDVCQCLTQCQVCQCLTQCQVCQCLTQCQVCQCLTQCQVCQCLTQCQVCQCLTQCQHIDFIFYFSTSQNSEITEADGNLGTDLGQAHKCGRVKSDK